MPEKSPENKHNSNKRLWTRREISQLLAKGAIGTTAVGIGAIIGYAIGKNEDEVASDAGTEIAALLDVTATTTVHRLKETTVSRDVLENGFTEEMINNLRKSIFIAQIYGRKKDSPNAKPGPVQYGTAWCAQKNTFITSRHLFYLPEGLEVTNVEILRPFMDRRYIQTNPKITEADMKDGDLAAFQSSGLDNVKPIPFIDNYSPVHEEKLLIVGYPIVFHNKSDVTKTITSVQILTINKIPSENDGTFRGTATENPGASGSPVLALVNGVPTVIGIISNANSDKPEASGWPLKISSLINKSN